MVLGELPIFKKLLPVKKNFLVRKTLGTYIPLEKLEVIQLFHVSPAKNRESILANGLIPKGKTEGCMITYGPAIFVSTRYEEAAFDYVNFENVDVWTFYLPKSLLNPDNSSSYANHYFIEVIVPSHKLRLLETL